MSLAYVNDGLKTKNRILLVALFLVFLLPILLAWYLVFFTEFQVRGVVHGTLIRPARLLTDVNLEKAGHNTQHSLRGKWTMLFFQNGACDTSCEAMLYRMRQIRLATGKNIKQVERAVMIGSNTLNTFIDKLGADYPGQLYLLIEETDKTFLRQFEDQKVHQDTPMFLIDPYGFLMMRYASDANPSGIIKDLKRLLRVASTE